MIASGADVDRVDNNSSGWTPLLKAVWRRRDKMVDFLIRNGADVNCKLRSGQRWFPLYLAAESGETLSARS